MTQLEFVRKGMITSEPVHVAIRENVTPEFIRDHVAAGYEGIRRHCGIAEIASR